VLTPQCALLAVEVVVLGEVLLGGVVGGHHALQMLSSKLMTASKT
jgi:hypothetical protein